MGTFKKIIGVTAGLLAGGFVASKIKKSIEKDKAKLKEIEEETRIKRIEEETRLKFIEEENRKRKNCKIEYDDNLSFDDFEQLALKIAKPIKRLHINVYDGYIVGTVTTTSGVNKWDFEIDFNDYGKITGEYWWSYRENTESTIPEKYAEELSQSIKNFISNKERKSNKNFLYCTNCGNEINNNVKFCSECGHKIITKKNRFCSECGSLLNDNVKFCSECGNKI